MSNSNSNSLLLALLILCPLSFFLSVISIMLTPNGDRNGIVGMSPWRWLFTFLVPLAITKRGLEKKSLDRSGAFAALVVGIMLTLTNYCFFASLAAFFLTASKLTKWRSHMKHKLEGDFKIGGQRNWLQVFCNGGIATVVSFLYMLEAGCREQVINFSSSYTASWLCMGVLGAIACASGDTYASEIGSVVGWGDPYLITSMRKVPRGTNGGVSIGGLLSSAIGGAVVGLAYYCGLLLCCTPEQLHHNPAQWPLIIVGALAGFVGSLVDSVLGAHFQYSGLDKECGIIVERPGHGVQQICGSQTLDNHGVNLISTFIMAIATPYMALTVFSNVS